RARGPRRSWSSRAGTPSRDAPCDAWLPTRSGNGPRRGAGASPSCSYGADSQPAAAQTTRSIGSGTASLVRCRAPLLASLALLPALGPADVAAGDVVVGRDARPAVPLTLLS